MKILLADNHSPHCGEVRNKQIAGPVSALIGASHV
jgi:hypothetical protein